MLKQQHQLFVGLLVLADALVIIAATLGAWLARWLAIDQGWWPSVEHLAKESLVLYTTPIVLLVMRWAGLYRPRRDRSIANEIATIFKASMVSLGAIIIAAYVLESSLFRERPVAANVLGVAMDAGRFQLGAMMLMLPVGLSIERAIFRTGLRWLRRRGWNLRHVVIIGTGRVAQIVARTFERNSWTGIKVRAFVSHQDRLRTAVPSSDESGEAADDAAGLTANGPANVLANGSSNGPPRTIECLGRPVAGGLDDLEAILERERPDAVYVALPRSKAGQISDVLQRLERFPVDVRLVPDLNPRYLPQSMKVSELDGMPILSYRENPTSGFGGVSKRVLDILGSAAGLVLLSPLLLLLALCVRLSGPGPVLFKQRRVSLGGQTFDIYKFRTMYHVEDESEETRLRLNNGQNGTDAWTQRNDPRVTSVGRWLRKTSLDELPQLINVLLGEMSLVGPRPERPELIDRFREDWRGYMLRQHVKAGMTGWAQVNGLRGQSSLRKRLQYDLFYVKNWSLGFDLKILWLTLFRGFVHRNAY